MATPANSDDDTFVITSGDFGAPAGVATPRNFFGYTFQDDALCHDRHHGADVVRLLESYSDNCGVFCGICRQPSRQTVVFTDPLGQYPVFYYSAGNRFMISNNFWLVAAEASRGQINEDAVYDYVTYMSPLNQETLAAGVRRLTSYEVLIVREADSGGSELLVSSIAPHAMEGPYRSLLEFAADRLKGRAAATLRAATPVAHFSGGIDTRLAFAAMASCGFTGPVFSFGDGTSQDRLIFQSFVERMGLSAGAIKWFHGPLNTSDAYLQAVLAFNGLKTNCFANWQPATDDTHMEVTGYFGGGLLRGFGRFWSAANSVDAFSFGRTVSVFSGEVFDHAERRMEREAIKLLDEAGGHRLCAEVAFYIRNRAAAHFGAQSAVNNRRFRSVDLLYDPVLLGLLRHCPHREAAIKQGAIGIDVIRAVHSDELAAFPYENRVIPAYDDWGRALDGRFSCFSNVRLLHRHLAPLKVQTVAASPGAAAVAVDQQPFPITSPVQFSAHPRHAGLFDAFPELRPGMVANEMGKRNAEFTSLASLAATHWLINEGRYSAPMPACPRDEPLPP
jgi:hypothetical protein